MTLSQLNLVLISRQFFLVVVLPLSSIYLQIPEPPESPVVEYLMSTGDFEVLPRSSSGPSVCNNDKRTKELMSLLMEIANEQGLDSQNYQCKGCGRNIG